MTEYKNNRNETLEDEDLKLITHVVERYLATQKGLRVTPLGSGSCNINFAVENDEGKIVVKLSKPYREYKAMGEYRKEEWCLGKAYELAIPSPEVLQIGQFEGRAYMIQSYVEGVPAASLEGVSSLSKSEQLETWRKLGEYIRKIHSIPVRGFGENMAEAGIFEGSWDNYLQYNIDSLSEDDPLIVMGVLSPDQSSEIRSAFQSLKDRKLQFGLCHGDIALRNAIVSERGEVSLLDWGTARAEVVPHYDFVEILRDSKPDQEALSAFFDGYGMTEAAFQEMRDDLHVMNLLRSLDTLRWAVDKMPEVVPEHVKTVQVAIRWFS